MDLIQICMLMIIPIIEIQIIMSILDLLITISCLKNNVNYHTYPRSDKYIPRKNPYHISNRNQASKNVHDINDRYAMPSFVYVNAYMPYDIVTSGPSSKKGYQKV